MAITEFCGSPSSVSFTSTIYGALDRGTGLEAARISDEEAARESQLNAKAQQIFDISSDADGPAFQPSFWCWTGLEFDSATGSKQVWTGLGASVVGGWKAAAPDRVRVVRNPA